MQMPTRHSITWETIKLASQKLKLYGASVLQKYSTEARGSANFSEISPGISEVFSEAFVQRCSVKLLSSSVSRAVLRPATLLKKRLWHRCFTCEFCKICNTFFYRTPLVAASGFAKGVSKNNNSDSTASQ